jgi:DNA polymerase-3 subunit delta
MVAISNGEADAFLASRLDRYGVILMFGPDQGLVSERARQAARAFLGGEGGADRIVQMSGDAVAADPLRLVDEANAIDMFQPSSRVLWIGVGGKSLLPALDRIAGAPPQACLVLLEGGDLRRDAPLRKWAETQGFAAAVECRQDDPKTLLRLIDQELTAVRRAIEPSARDALLGVLGEDRLATRHEIEKLLLFTSGKELIERGDVEAVCADPNVARTDAIVDGVFALDRESLLATLLEAFPAGADPGLVLLALMRHALALQKALAAGGSGADALQSLLRSTGGYSRKAELARQLKTWGVEDTVALLQTLQDFTRESRANPTLSTERLVRLLMARARQRSVGGGAR